MISFVHIRSADNCGDMASCPGDCFPFGDCEILNYTDTPKGNVVVYGGGTMVNWLNGRTDLPDATKIIWGAGSSRHGKTEPWPDPEGFDLVGMREWSPEREGRYAPCVSCMLPMLDNPPPPYREAVLFVNASDNIRLRYPSVYKVDLPALTNAAPLKHVIEHLASAEVVVTNSYHGVYWATLMRRKVVCVPYSSKFYGFKFPPAYSKSGRDWRELAEEATVHPTALRTCREDTLAFRDRVQSVALGMAA